MRVHCGCRGRIREAKRWKVGGVRSCVWGGGCADALGCGRVHVYIYI